MTWRLYSPCIALYSAIADKRNRENTKWPYACLYGNACAWLTHTQTEWKSRGNSSVSKCVTTANEASKKLQKRRAEILENDFRCQCELDCEGRSRSWLRMVLHFLCLRTDHLPLAFERIPDWVCVCVWACKSKFNESSLAAYTRHPFNLSVCHPTIKIKMK